MSYPLQFFEKEHIKKNFNFKSGDEVKISCKIFEDGAEKIQSFEGTVIRIRGRGLSKTFTVRKISYGVGVERIFLLHSPTVINIEVLKKGKVRRAKLYYIRKKIGKESKIESEEIQQPTKQTDIHL